MSLPGCAQRVGDGPDEGVDISSEVSKRSSIGPPRWSRPTRRTDDAFCSGSMTVRGKDSEDTVGLHRMGQLNPGEVGDPVREPLAIRLAWLALVCQRSSCSKAVNWAEMNRILEASCIDCLRIYGRATCVLGPERDDRLGVHGAIFGARRRRGHRHLRLTRMPRARPRGRRQHWTAGRRRGGATCRVGGPSRRAQRSPRPGNRSRPRWTG